jgi:hypothetical protein
MNAVGRVPPEREWLVIEMEYFPSRTLAQVFEAKETSFAASYAAIFRTFQQIFQGAALHYYSPVDFKNKNN